MTLKDSLGAKIAGAKRRHQPFYIGSASKCGRRAVDAARNRDNGGHHADEKVYSHRLNRVNYTRLLQGRSVCMLESYLIAKHGNHRLCLNEKQGQLGCIKANQGIVYVRTYSRRNSLRVRRPKNWGAPQKSGASKNRSASKKLGASKNRKTPKKSGASKNQSAPKKLGASKSWGTLKKRGASKNRVASKNRRTPKNRGTSKNRRVPKNRGGSKNRRASKIWFQRR